MLWICSTTARAVVRGGAGGLGDTPAVASVLRDGRAGVAWGDTLAVASVLRGEPACYGRGGGEGGVVQEVVIK